MSDDDRATDSTVHQLIVNLVSHEKDRMDGSGL